MVISLAAAIVVYLSSSVATPAQPSEGTAVAQRVADVIAQRYVFPEVGQRIAAYIRERAAKGVYGKLTPAQLVDTLTQDLKKENGDRHLYVQYQAGSASPAPAPGGGPVRVTPGGSSQSRELARRRNYYLNRVERLDGNVGYLEIRRFFGSTEEARAAAAAAMAFLADTDAMIIDVRNAPGGDGMMVDLIASYFFDKVTPTLHTYSRSRNETIERTTLENVPGKRRPSIPLYVLTSRDTGSAAEDFAFLLQQTGRATLVGDRTAGAGHTNAIMGIGGGYTVSVSIGRTYNPKTNQGWEGVGVQPHVNVPPSEALDAAHVQALTALMEKADAPALKKELEWSRDAIEARRKPPSVDERTLQSYAGQYGARAIRFQGGRLWYQRLAGAELVPLTTISSTEFAMGEGQRFQFMVSGGAIEMRMLSADGASLAYARQ
jgi:retinol-binding protein 3